MVIKSLTIVEEAYNALKRFRRENQSFSKVVIEVTKSGNSINKFFGAIKDSKKELEEMKKKIKEDRVLTDRLSREKENKINKRLYGRS